MTAARARVIVALMLLAALAARADAQSTDVQYLSGTGHDDTVDWEFMVDGGRRAGEWATIPVPSNWELQGFGTYNYGHDGTRNTIPIANETGHYRHRFSVPADWRGSKVDIVFDGSMTDTHVRVNGRSAGPPHQGAFYRFRYDISQLLTYDAENVLEVEVHKRSANDSVNEAERQADFWVFGGIFRPVWLEARPAQHIERVALDARHDGSFGADVFVGGIEGPGRVVAQVRTLQGESVGAPFDAAVPAGAASVKLATRLADIRAWSAEFPNLYLVDVALEQEGRRVHVVTERFGFRTVEVRPNDGLYLNGRKIRLKGVNRHSFWPDSGRTTSRALSEADARLIKDMNMNAVRVSHYPPDKHFLEVADTVGLYVIDELTGWQDAYDTTVGEQLVRELVTRDVNHPSVIFWANGNEGGFNFDLEDDYARWDPQARTVLHPWLNSNGVNTGHYETYYCCTGQFFEGDDLILTTELLHGLYDGGAAAGLADWWERIMANPLAVGGFLWAFADEGVVRTDRDGEIDTDGNHGPDGIVGPYREKEGSYYAIKEIWSPIYLEWSRQDRLPASFEGRLRVENRYAFTDLSQVSLRWQLLAFGRPGDPGGPPRIVSAGASAGQAVAPGAVGELHLDLPADWRSADALALTATDPHGHEIYAWTWMIASPAGVRSAIVTGGAPATGEETADRVVLRSGPTVVEIDRGTGLLATVRHRDLLQPLANGPRLLGESGTLRALRHGPDGNDYVVRADYADGEFERIEWRLQPGGWLRLDYSYRAAGGERDYLGVTFDFPEGGVTGMTWLGKGPFRVWKNRMQGVEFGVWDKAINNTMTGQQWEYPEFKGFHSDIYWALIRSTEGAMTVVTDTEDLFVRVLTPRFTEDAKFVSYSGVWPEFARVVFPDGDLSFLHGIAPIGTKFHPAQAHGPEGRPNLVPKRGARYEAAVYFHFGHDVPKATDTAGSADAR